MSSSSQRASRMAWPIWICVSVCLVVMMLACAARTLGTPQISSHPASLSFPFAVADFDGDSQPDLATVQSGDSSATHYWIRFQLSGGSRQAIGVTAPMGGLRISPVDVNGDNFPDLIVTTALLRQPVAVLLNDGHGNFLVRDPAAFPPSIWGTENIWTAAASEIKDSVAAILPRSFPGTCAANPSASSPQRVGKLLFSRSISLSGPLATFSSLGRAPPRISSL